MSSALITSTRCTRAGVGKLTGPATCLYGSFGQGKAHFAGAVVGYIAHRIDSFARRSGIDQHMLATKNATLKALGCARCYVGWLQHAPWPDVAAGLSTAAGAKYVHLARQQQLQVGLGSGVTPHCLIHRRSEHYGGVGG